MRARSAVASTVLVLLAAVGACRDSLAPDGARVPSEVRLASGLRLSVEVAPAAVRAGDSVTVRVLVTNPSSAPVQVTSGCGGLTMFGFRRADGRESLLSVGYGYRTVVRTLTLDAHETVAHEHRFPTRTYEGAPVPPGVYRAQAFSNLSSDHRADGRGGTLPNAEAAFVVR